MRLKDSTYDFLKWYALIAIPAIEGFWLTVGKVWGFPYLTEIGTTIAAVGILIAALIGVSTKNYKKSQNMNVPEPEDSYSDRVYTDEELAELREGDADV